MKMSLTDKAMFDRIWGPYPTIANLISNKRLDNVRWTGQTTASNNIFEEITRIIEIQALVQGHSDEIKAHIIIESNLDKGNLICELNQLEDAIHRISNELRSFAEDIKKISTD